MSSTHFVIKYIYAYLYKIQFGYWDKKTLSYFFYFSDTQLQGKTFFQLENKPYCEPCYMVSNLPCRKTLLSGL